MSFFTSTKTPFYRIISVSGVALALQSCGSSGTGDAPEGEIFSDPIDASALQEALITGTTVNDEGEFWRCALDGTDTVFVYRLLADGSGTEADLSNPSDKANFNWQTTSASTISTAFPSTGESFSLTDIRFSGSDAVSMIFAESGSKLDCTRENIRADEPTFPQNPNASNSLFYGDVTYPLTHGFEEAFSYRPTRGDTHSTSEFEVADGVFTQTLITVVSPPVVIWRPNDATVWLRADLHSPNDNGFEVASFEYVSNEIDEQGPLVSGKFFFNEGRFGVDINNDGDIDSDSNEFFDIVGGTITVNRTSNPMQMSFDVTLETGVNVNGNFAGTFPVYEHD